MILIPVLLSLSSPASPAPPGDLLAIKARRAETVANGTLEHAVILIEDGKIVSIGEDLPIERGIPILELPDDYVVLPGLINVYSRVGLDGKGFNDSRPSILASDELYPSDAYESFVEAGITTLAHYPSGNGIPGQAVVIRKNAEKATFVDNPATPYWRILQDKLRCAAPPRYRERGSCP